MSSPSNLPVVQGLPQIEGTNVLTGEDLAVLQYVLSATQTANIIKMRKSQERMEECTKRYQEMQIPVSAKSFPVTVGTTITEVKFPEPLTGFAIENDGPGNIQFRVNEKKGLEDELQIAAGDGWYYDFKFAIVKRIYFQADAEATVWIECTVGKSV